MSDIQSITAALIKFRDDREWAQFHDSKNLALAISIEAAELNELFLWKEGAAAEEVDKDRLREELADILSFCFLLADKHKLDVKEMVMDKIRLNDKKYPVEKARGTAKKYNDL
jgi:NTP pyrophosphatase (non-canonical NTP hydrolase)